MRHKLKGTKVHPLVMPVLAARHVPVVTDDLADVFRWHLLLLHVNEAKLSLLSILLIVELLPSVGGVYQVESLHINMHEMDGVKEFTDLGQFSVNINSQGYLRKCSL